MSSALLNSYSVDPPPVDAATAVIVYTAEATAPDGWLLCDGAAVSRTTYAALFAAIGTTFGAGDGSTTFNLPDASDRFIIGAGSTYSAAATGGADTHVLTASEMASHTHYSGSSNRTQISNTQGGLYSESNWSQAAGGYYSTSSAGSGSAHENKPPFLGMNVMIKT